VVVVLVVLVVVAVFIWIVVALAAGKSSSGLIGHALKAPQQQRRRTESEFTASPQVETSLLKKHAPPVM